MADDAFGAWRPGDHGRHGVTLTVGALTDAAAVRDAVRDAGASGRPLRITGAGRWLDAGRPVRATDHLSLAAHVGIVEYTPGDLTLTARSGTTLDEIERVTRAEQQWLALDPFGASGTLGATVATASSGPLSQMFGTPRDNVLGLEFVSGDGAVVRGGGRVVKNVAGFDLVRLLVGSWGTLGVITEVTVRLRSIPEADRSFALALPDRPMGLEERIEAVRRAALAPWALELLNAALAGQLGVGDGTTLLVRFGGNAELVAAEHELLASFGDTQPVGADVWRRLREIEPADAVVVRFSQRPSQLWDTWRQVSDIARDLRGVMAHATVGRGIVRVIVPRTDVAALERALWATRVDARIFERLPASLWPTLAPSPTADRLSRRVKDSFDPHHLLNPGILGEEAA
jgi:glycolate dehydrogenase FAD-binding subunit